jgi:hypothetical protein
MIAFHVARLIAAIEVFINLSDENLLDPDAAVDMGEIVSRIVQDFDKPFLREVVDAFPLVARDYEGEAQALVLDIPIATHLEDELAEGDPVRLAELDAIRDARP